MTKIFQSDIEEVNQLLARAKRNSNGCLEVGKTLYPTTSCGHRITRVILSMQGYDAGNKNLYACHKCDNPRCINPDHIFPGSSSDNQKDFWGKVKKGILHRNKLGEEWVSNPPYIPVEDK